MLPGINKIPLRVNPAQWQFVMLQSKNKYAIFSRDTGKSWIVGYEVDENVRLDAPHRKQAGEAGN